MRQRMTCVSSTSSGSSRTSERRQDAHRGAGSPKHRHAHRNEYEQAQMVVGGVGKLFRLVIVALVLAMITPYLRTYLFGNSTRSNGINNTTNTSVNKQYAQIHDKAENSNAEKATHQGDQGVQGEQGEQGVFNFKHQDYVPAVRRNKLDTQAIMVTALPSPTAVIPKPHSRTTPTSNLNDQHHPTPPICPSPSPSPSRSHSTPPSLSTWSSLWRFLQLTYAILGYILLPIHFTFRLIGCIWYSVYHWISLASYHMIRLMVVVLAPLTYLVHGILFVFIQSPIRIILRILIDLYPIYIYLGAAIMLGLFLGFGATTILYLSAFIFVDQQPLQLIKTTTSMMDQ